jgi:prepilin-type N-terminal cleavage/methylation domain-containing protein
MRTRPSDEVQLSDERGFTLVEMLAAMVIGITVLFALFAIVDTAVHQQARAVDRIEANDGGRLTIDLISQQLGSRVCVSGTQGSLVSGTDNEVEFFASLGMTPESTTEGQRLILQRRRLIYRPANHDVREEVWVGTQPAPALPPGPNTLPAVRATTTRVLLTRVEPVGTTPFFRYFAMTGSPAQPTQLLATPLAATDLSAAARINISFLARGKVAGVSSELHNQVLDRSPGCYFG